ncbi:MAG TPA: three-Cys-motif partner protein TcmP [Pyrinomonadaceae bacterium]|nr:three-Cys-motif partner protein TcmP [Pyrinomonadaceae bacterium]
MTTSDRKHFENYRDQTRVKHEILEAYLPAYFHILKASNQNLVFIDGFAGRGTYTMSGSGEIFDGSPLRALKLIARNSQFATQVSTIFIESDRVLFDQLKTKVDDFVATHPEVRRPLCLDGRFSDRLNEVLDKLEGNLAPTFLFVDPCGVSGASFNTIQRVMNFRKCEAFIFFNIDGVRRIAGLESVSDVLIELLGSEARANEFHNALRASSDVQERERMILTHYCAALREEIGARYLIPFRVEHEEQHRTSHYLIHATKHPLGFKIMKDVMWRRGHSEEQPGALELRQSSRTNLIPMFDQRGDIKKEILSALEQGPRKVSVFYGEWTARRTMLNAKVHIASCFWI